MECGRRVPLPPWAATFWEMSMQVVWDADLHSTVGTHAMGGMLGQRACAW